MEKRTDRRHAIEKTVACSPFVTGKINAASDGRMLNYCACGMCAELGAEFKKGAIVLLRTKDSPTDPPAGFIREGFRSVSLAEVRWSRPVTAAGHLRFTTGFRYF
jgi:hypothetical protein